MKKLTKLQLATRDLIEKEVAKWVVDEYDSAIEEGHRSSLAAVYAMTQAKVKLVTKAKTLARKK